jgi:hypothetical protein
MEQMQRVLADSSSFGLKASVRQLVKFFSCQAREGWHLRSTCGGKSNGRSIVG